MSKKRLFLLPLLLIALSSGWGGDFFTAAFSEIFPEKKMADKCFCRSYPEEGVPVPGGELSLANELPGTFAAFRSSRRNDDFLRNFRPRNNDTPELTFRFVDLCSKCSNVFELLHTVFSFHNFLQESLPPRAGPFAV